MNPLVPNKNVNKFMISALLPLGGRVKRRKVQVISCLHEQQTRSHKYKLCIRSCDISTRKKKSDTTLEIMKTELPKHLKKVKKEHINLNPNSSWIRTRLQIFTAGRRRPIHEHFVLIPRRKTSTGRNVLFKTSSSFQGRPCQDQLLLRPIFTDSQGFKNQAQGPPKAAEKRPKPHSFKAKNSPNPWSGYKTRRLCRLPAETNRASRGA